METAIRLIIYGRPQQRGSKTPQLIRRKGGAIVLTKGGTPLVTVRDDNKKSKDWMACVRQAAAEQYGQHELLRGPLQLSAVFYFQRPGSHFGSGKNAGHIKSSAPTLHAQTPDLSKLLRSLEDALTGMIYSDDRLICRYVDCRREWTTEQERAEVTITLLAIPGQIL